MTATGTATGTEFVHGDREVLRALVRRRDSGSRLGERTDGHRIALVVGGGGMRGVYAGGMIQALGELGLRESFDEVYGTSAGAFNAAAFVTGYAWGAARIYFEDLTCHEFIDFRRPWRRGPVVSLDYLINHVLAVSKPLPWAELIDSPLPLHVVGSRLPDLSPHVLTGLRSAADWKRALRATATIPVLAGRPVELHGQRWVDGSVSEPLAVARALRAGATHVLVLLSRAASEVLQVNGNGTTDVNGAGGTGRLPAWARSLDRVAPGLGTLANGSARYADDLRLIGSRPRLLGLAPSWASGATALTIDPDRVRRAGEIGHASLHAALATTVCS